VFPAFIGRTGLRRPPGLSTRKAAAYRQQDMPDRLEVPEAFLLTPLPSHGGSCPPLVVGAGSAIRLDVRQGHGGVRLEVDGQAADAPLGPLTVRFRAGAATVVAFRDQERLLAVLRKRQIITDSPRILVEDTQH
jgi:hypothetical protein